MDYARIDTNGQLVFEQSTEVLHIPYCLFGFHNTETLVGKAASGRTIYCFQGKLDLSESERRCECGKRMHVNSHPDITLGCVNSCGTIRRCTAAPICPRAMKTWKPNE